jgi:hypothetical protein
LNRNEKKNKKLNYNKNTKKTNSIVRNELQIGMAASIYCIYTVQEGIFHVGGGNTSA